MAAINAGIDMNMVPYNYRVFVDTLTAAVDNGDVPAARIDDAVRRILTVKFELGLWERPLTDDSRLDQVGSADHRELTRQAVRESLVLLQNDGATLPIGGDTPIIFIAGEAADDIGIQSGGWSISWQGRSGNVTQGTTIRSAIAARAGAGSETYYNRFGNFDRFTDDAGDPLRADVGIVVVGERPYAEGVGDSDSLTLPEADLSAIANLRQSSSRVVVVILSGRPVMLDAVLPLADAVIAAWLPGTEGAGVADVLFGDYPFSGTLSFTWPRTVDQLPFDFGNVPVTGCDAPLFPIGYGLQASDANDPQPVCP